MKKQRLFVWAAANAFGLGLAFVASLQTWNLIAYGVDTWMNWKPIPSGHDFSALFASLVAQFVGGTILGCAQVLVLRSLLPRVVPWLLATAAGFCLMVVIMWPLQATEILGRIPGPVEPILATVGSCSVAGYLQFRMLRTQGVVASRWLVLWVIGLVLSLVPTALLFMSLEALSVPLSWPVEVFLSGFPVAGVAALISGQSLFAAVSSEPTSGASLQTAALP